MDSGIIGLLKKGIFVTRLLSSITRTNAMSHFASGTYGWETYKLVAPSSLRILIQVFNQILTFFSFILLYLIIANLNLLKFSHYFFLTFIFYPGSIFLLSSYSEPQVLFICLYFINYLYAKNKKIIFPITIAYFFFFV